jgi:hypothetical protein
VHLQCLRPERTFLETQMGLLVKVTYENNTQENKLGAAEVKKA